MPSLRQRYFNEYRVYVQAKNRCTNPKDVGFRNYGGRGIQFLFENFEQFISCLGPRPEGKYQLDRIDNESHYQLGNVRWVTVRNNLLNKRNNRILTYGGKTQTASEWADELGINPVTLYARLTTYGWTVEQALSTPVRARTQRFRQG